MHSVRPWTMQQRARGSAAPPHEGALPLVTTVAKRADKATSAGCGKTSAPAAAVGSNCKRRKARRHSGGAAGRRSASGVAQAVRVQSLPAVLVVTRHRDPARRPRPRLAQCNFGGAGQHAAARRQEGAGAQHERERAI